MAYVGYNPGNIPVPPFAPIPPAPAPVPVPIPPAPPYGPQGKIPNPGFIIDYTGLSTDSADVVVNNQARTIAVNIKSDLLNNYFVYQTDQPMSNWDINHGLNKYPNINLVDNTNSAIMGDIHYVDLNHIVVSFTEPICGRAFLS